MIQSILHDTTLPALAKSAAFAERRHTLLAGNVANVDTPGYRARDLSVDHFQQTLAESIAHRNQPSVGRRYSPDRLEQDPLDDSGRAMEQLVYHDGSAVNMERQVAEMAKNQSMHSLAIALMRSQFNTLNAAISERV